MLERPFKISSYAMVLLGSVALLLSGAIGWKLSLIFMALLGIAISFEGRRWQLSERIGLLLLFIVLPLLYLDWRQQMAIVEGDERAAGMRVLVHLLLSLSAIRLLQKKRNRDWIFLYLISFFEIFLAAGLTTRPAFLAIFCLYILAALMAAICFELGSAKRRGWRDGIELLYRMDRRGGRLLGGVNGWSLLAVASALSVLIFALALPIFFFVPRFEGGAFARAGGGIAGFVGFAKGMRLGDIGRLQQSDRIVMRVRVEGGGQRLTPLRWRGVALDRFDGTDWTRSSTAALIVRGSERNLFQLGTVESLHRLTTETFFLEPIDTSVLFAAPRVVAVQGALPFVRVDAEGGLSSLAHPFERLTYRVYSDVEEPDAQTLRADRLGALDYPAGYARYLQLPANLDPRIAALASTVIKQAGAQNVYDAARAIESYLQTNYRYSLEMRASGPDPLADFLFRVRAGHCEYFSSAMTIMLRTQGIAARVVNGFKTGEYNDAADVYVVRQRDAHSWVEVYFPTANFWASFDPTPFVPFQDGAPSGSWSSDLRKYAEALDLLWWQYVIGYDQQEQRQLARVLNRKLRNGRDDLAAWGDEVLRRMRTDAQARRALWMVVLLMFVALATFKGRGLLRIARWWKARRGERTTIDFYDRMTEILAQRGYKRTPHQTPLEFAAEIGMPEAVMLTRAYNRVRYGGRGLSAEEEAQVENWLRRLEEELVVGKGLSIIAARRDSR